VTLAWPVLRRALHRLSERTDRFHLTRAELLAGETLDTTERQRQWEEDRRLSPPAVLGRPPFLLRRLLLPKMVEPEWSATVLKGHAASPGRAVGPVRILRDPEQLGCVRPGDVLVTTAAVPALTVTFGTIAALCVDSGSAAAHAAVVAREYALPTVTGLHDATVRLRDGQLVTVDGTRGVVEL
jgi:pyruvate,water dikinase